MEQYNDLGWKDHPFQTPCHRQGFFLLDQVAQRPILPGLEPFK